MKNFDTKNWIIAILIATWIATFIVGYLHVAEIFSEPGNPIMHTFKDWIIVAVITLPISYIIARVIPSK